MDAISGADMARSPYAGLNQIRSKESDVSSQPFGAPGEAIDLAQLELPYNGGSFAASDLFLNPFY